MAKWGAYSTDFPNSTAPLGWTGYGTRTFSDNKLHVPITGSNYGGLTRYGDDLLASAVYVKVEPGTSGQGGIDFYDGGTVRIQMYVSGTSFVGRIGGSTVFTLTYNATDHAFWQVREAGGTVYLETSPSGADGSWTTRGSGATPAGMDTADVDLYGGGGSAGGGEFQFSKFNRPTSLPSFVGMSKTATGASPLTVSYPAGGTSDLLLMVLSVASNHTVDTPSGWVLYDVVTGFYRQYVFIRTIDTSSSGTFALTHNANPIDAVRVYRFKNVNQGTPFANPGTKTGANGVFDYLGEHGGVTAWSNPVTNGQVVASASSLYPHPDLPLNGNVIRATDQASTTFETDAGGAGQWIRWDFGGGRTVTVDSYMFRSRDDGFNSFHPRNWALQGSNDGSTWTNLREHINDSTITAAGTWYTFAVTGAAAWRYIRFYQTANSNNVSGNYLVFSEIELYGTFSPALGSVVSAATKVALNASSANSQVTSGAMTAPALGMSVMLASQPFYGSATTWTPPTGWDVANNDAPYALLVKDYAAGGSIAAQTFSTSGPGNFTRYVAHLGVTGRVAGAAYDEPLADTATSSDAAPDVKGANEPLADSASTDDSVVLVGGYLEAVAVSLAATDEITSQASLVDALTSTATSSDASSDGNVIEEPLADSASTADAISLNDGYLEAVSVSLATTDSITSQLSLSEALASAATSADQVIDEATNASLEELADEAWAVDHLTTTSGGTEHAIDTLTSADALVEVAGQVFHYEEALNVDLAAQDALATLWTTSDTLGDAASSLDASSDGTAFVELLVTNSSLYISIEDAWAGIETAEDLLAAIDRGRDRASFDPVLPETPIYATVSAPALVVEFVQGYVIEEKQDAG